jgi:hypothetical protein
MGLPGRLAVVLLAAASLRGCIAYEYEHEFWLKVNGSGRVHVTGQPWLWNAFKGLGSANDPDGTTTREAARALFERSGLHVRTVTLTHRQGRPYLFVAADFDDVSRLSGTPAFPDLDVRMVPDGERLRLEGTWQKKALVPQGRDTSGVMAVRFHLPSKVYDHRNAAEGVERGNIVAWRQDLAAALRGEPLTFHAVIDRRSILWSTLSLFAGAIVLALGALGTTLFFVFRRGRRAAATSASPPPGS